MTLGSVLGTTTRRGRGAGQWATNTQHWADKVRITGPRIRRHVVGRGARRTNGKHCGHCTGVVVIVVARQRAVQEVVLLASPVRGGSRELLVRSGREKETKEALRVAVSLNIGHGMKTQATPFEPR